MGFCLPAPSVTRGFTLVEMMIAIVVSAVLLAIALPSFQQQLRKGRRSDAMAALGQLQLAQERWRANNLSYSSSLSDLGVGASSAGGHYTLSVADATGSSYTLVATAQPSSSQAHDLDCFTMRITMAAGSISYGAMNSDGVLDAGDTRRCWAR